MQTQDSGLLQGEAPSRNQPKVVIGIFAYNNEGVIQRIISPLGSISSEVVVCDDASTDSTARIAQTLNAQVITQPHRLGLGAGMRSLFLAASQARADVLVTVPTDSVCDASSILSLVNSVMKREADIVIGSRTPLRQVDLSVERSSSLLTVYGLPVHDPRSPFKAYGKVAIATMVSQPAEKTDILRDARKLGLGVMEYEITTRALSAVKATRPGARSVNPVVRLVEYTAIKHPIEFYGGAATVALIAALVKSILTYQAFIGGRGLPEFDVIVIVALFLVWVILNVAGAVLYSLSRNAAKRDLGVAATREESVIATASNA